MPQRNRRNSKNRQGTPAKLISKNKGNGAPRSLSSLRALGFETLEDRRLMAVQPFPVPLNSMGAPGSLVYGGLASAAIDSSGEIESFTISLDAGQQITLVVDPTTTALTPTLEILDPSSAPLGGAVATSGDENAVLQSINVAAAGVYTINVSGAGGSLGGFSLRAVLNSALEADRVGGPANDTAGAAQDIDASFVPIGSGSAERGAVLGLGSGVGPLFTASQTHTNDVFSPNVLTYNFSGAPAPIGDATLTLTAIADLDSSSEFLTLNAEGLFVQDVFVIGGLQQVLVTTTVTIPQATLQQLTSDGTISFTVTPSSGVNNLGNNSLTLDLSYPTSGGPGLLGGWYSFSLEDGESATIVASAAAQANHQVALYAPDGTTLLAEGSADSAGNLVIDGFVDGTTDLAPAVYYLRVDSSAEYSVVVTRNAGFEQEPNNDLAPDAQDITLDGAILGSVQAGGLGGPGDVIKVGVLNTISSTVTTQLASAGMNATTVLVTDVEAGSLIANNFDVLVLGRVYGGSVSQAFVDSVVSFIAMGGGVVTEWDGAALLFDGYHSTYRFSTANPQSHLLEGQIGSGESLNTGTPLTRAVDHPIWAGLPLQFSAGGGTEFFFTTFGFDTNEIEVIATYQGNGTTNFPNQSFPAVFVARDLNIVGMPFDWQDEPSDPNLVTLYTNAVRFADDGGGSTDNYSVSTNAGDVLSIQTTIPAAGPGEFVNNLDIAIELYDPLGNLAASDASGSLTHVATLAGAYTVRVLAEGSTRGEYLLSVTGHTGALAPFEVTASNPPNGASLIVAPTELTVDLSDEVLLSTVSASDLTVDGVPAASVTVVDQDTLRFSFPALADGAHTLAIAAGALQDLQGQSLAAFSNQVTVDANGPRVVASSVLEGDILNAAATLNITLSFDELLDASALDAGDVQLVGLEFGSQTPAAFSYDAQTSTLTLQYAGLPEDEYTLTLFSSAQGFHDQAGNLLDGEPHPATTVPSGNNVPGGDFSVHFAVETSLGAFPTPFVPAGPLGSLIYASNVSGRIAPAADVDEFVINLDAGQRLSLIVAAEFQGVVTLLGPGGSPVATTSAGAAGEQLLLEGVPVDAPGAYTVRIESLGGTGDYSIDALLNAIPEREAHGGAVNDSPLDAENLDGAFVVLPGGSSQIVSVVGIANAGGTGVLFEDAFPTQTFDPAKWSLVTNATIDNIGIAEPSEPFSARFNGNPNGGDLLQSAIIDLSGQTAATLTYSFEQTGGGETVDSGEDLVFAFQNASGVWVEFDRQLGSGPNMTTYQLREVALPAAALHANFRFRITNNGSTGTFDDWFVDNITLQGNAVTPDPGDWYQFSLADGQSASIAVAAAVGDVTLNLFDATGAVKLASGISGSNWSQVIQSFVDRTNDGAANDYLIQIIGSNIDYQLTVTRDAALETEPNNNFGDAQDASGVNNVLGHVSAGGEDWFEIAVNNGDVLAIGAATPGGGPFEFVNPMGESLSLRVELYDPSGALVAPQAESINHLATLSGNYRVRVLSLGAGGEYFLSVDGATGMNTPPQVVAISPPDGTLVNQFPTSFSVTFSEPLLEGTVDAGDLLINGQPAATAVTQDGPMTFTFTVDPAVNVGNGVYAVTLPAGAIEDLQGELNDVFTVTFTYDALGPVVTNVLFNGAPLPLVGQLLAGSLTVEAFFSEDLHEELTPGQLGPEDVVLANKLTGATTTPTAVTYDAALNKVILVFPAVDESVYELTLVSGDGAFEDVAGNDLDGEPFGPGPIGAPSGDGSAGGNYRIQFSVDAVGSRATAPFERLLPLGSFMAVSQGNVGVIGSPGDVDDYQVTVENGQLLSAVLTPANPAATMFLSIVGVAGPVFAVTPGAAIALPPELIPATGPLTLRVFGDATTSYTLDVYANAGHELVVGDSADGNELPLDDTRLTLGSGRWGAIGEIAANPSLSTVYMQDFNLGVGSFVFDNTTIGSGNGLWHRSTGRQSDGAPNHSPAGSLYFGQNEGPLGSGNYNTGTATAGAATAPSIALPSASVILLSLNYLLQTDAAPGRDVAAVAVNAGAGFVTVASTADGSLDSNTSGQWKNLTVDLSQYRGQTVSLRFTFDSVNALQNEFEGWYVDDVQIQAAVSYLADIDEYTLDLTSYVGRPIDFIISGESHGGLADATVTVLGPDGSTVLATATTNPGGVVPVNFDQAVLGFTPALPGTYTLRIISDEPGQYGVLVTESLPFEAEPNNVVNTGLQRLDGVHSRLGFLGDGDHSGSASKRMFTISISTREIVELNPADGAELNRIPIPGTARLGGPDGLAFIGGSLFYATGGAYGGGTLYELDPDDGAILDSDALTTVGASAAVDGLGGYAGLIFTVDYTAQRVYFIDAATDSVVGSWASNSAIVGGAAGAGSRGSVFVTASSATILELDADTGQLLNSLPGVGSAIYGLAYAGGSLYAGSSTGTIYELDPDTGAVRNTYSPGLAVWSLGGDDSSGLPPTFAAPLEPLPSTGLAPAGGDFYRIDLLQGQQVTLSTRTPWAGPSAASVNDLNTQLIVYDNLGALIGIDSDSADGKNALISFIAATSGPYFVQVVAESGAGEYLLDATIEPAPIPGDFNRDGSVDGADLGVWGSSFGSTGADADWDGDSDGADFLAWQRNLGQSVGQQSSLSALGTNDGNSLATQSVGFAAPEDQFEGIHSSITNLSYARLIDAAIALSLAKRSLTETDDALAIEESVQFETYSDAVFEDYELQTATATIGLSRGRATVGADESGNLTHSKIGDKVFARRLVPSLSSHG